MRTLNRSRVSSATFLFVGALLAAAVAAMAGCSIITPDDGYMKIDNPTAAEVDKERGIDMTQATPVEFEQLDSVFATLNGSPLIIRSREGLERFYGERAVNSISQDGSPAFTDAMDSLGEGFFDAWDLMFLEYPIENWEKDGTVTDVSVLDDCTIVHVSMSWYRPTKEQTLVQKYATDYVKVPADACPGNIEVVTVREENPLD